MLYGTVLFAICFGVFYYRLGEAEYGSGALLALVSVSLWMLGVFLLKLGILGNLLLQVALFGALTVWNITRPPRGD